MANQWLREAVRAAEKNAIRLKHGEFTAAHLFVGLVQYQGPVNKVVTQRKGVTLNRLHETLRIVGATSVGVLPGGSVTYTAAVNEALALAEGRAKTLGHVGGATREDAAVALLLQQDDRVVDLLKQLGLDRYELLQVFAPDIVLS